MAAAAMWCGVVLCASRVVGVLVAAHSFNSVPTATRRPGQPHAAGSTCRWTSHGRGGQCLLYAHHSQADAWHVAACAHGPYGSERITPPQWPHGPCSGRPASPRLRGSHARDTDTPHILIHSQSGRGPSGNRHTVLSLLRSQLTTAHSCAGSAIRSPIPQPLCTRMHRPPRAAWPAPACGDRRVSCASSLPACSLRCSPCRTAPQRAAWRGRPSPRGGVARPSLPLRTSRQQCH